MNDLKFLMKGKEMETKAQEGNCTGRRETSMVTERTSEFASRAKSVNKLSVGGAQSGVGSFDIWRIFAVAILKNKSEQLCRKHGVGTCSW